MKDNKYDYIIIGAGAAGSNLLLEFLRHSQLSKKEILILDNTQKNINDKTWCFWEKDSTEVDELVSFEWSNTRFVSNKTDLRIDISPYRYKKVRSLDLYNHIKKVISDNENITFKKEKVMRVDENQDVKVVTDKGIYTSDYVFDSRIDQDFFSDNNGSLNVKQHFIGWFIKTDKPVFIKKEFTMMDYRIKWENDTAFTYILPTSEYEALVEFTLFTPYLIDKDQYEEKIREYFEKILNIETYEVLDTESGIIPMSNYKFHKNNTEKMIKIGTAGSWVKASSGYSFYNSRKLSKKIAKNLIDEKNPGLNLFKKRYRIYDTIFLDILQKDNEKGEKVFTEMFRRNKIEKVFKFLDEDTNFIEDLIIIVKFNPLPFLKAVFRQTVGRLFSKTQ